MQAVVEAAFDVGARGECPASAGGGAEEVDDLRGLCRVVGGEGEQAACLVEFTDRVVLGGEPAAA